MPKRTRMLVPPDSRWERAAWLDEHMPKLLEGISLDHAPRGWAPLAELERKVFPKAMHEFLGGSLDPTCPRCGIETDEGTVERQESGLFRVTYQTCGCVWDMTEEQLRSRVRSGV